MPTNLDIFSGHCDYCDFEWCQKNAKGAAMVKRLHNKKCKKEGRTKEPEWVDGMLNERFTFARAVGNINTHGIGRTGPEEAWKVYAYALKIRKEFKETKGEEGN